jgi:hypothetical protein
MSTPAPTPQFTVDVITTPDRGVSDKDDLTLLILVGIFGIIFLIGVVGFCFQKSFFRSLRNGRARDEDGN